jgi:hypothetical protein
MSEHPTVTQYRNGYARGVEEERARIRRELDEWIGETGRNRTPYPGGDPETWIKADDLVEALDRIIIPEP